MKISIIALICLFILMNYYHFSSMNSSENIYGCWNSVPGRSKESFIDSLYEITNFYVHFRMCFDENNNIEIIKKVLEDCCSESTYKFSGKYKLYNDTILISINGTTAWIEKYVYKVITDTLFLVPVINDPSINNITFQSGHSSTPLLKYKWVRY